MGMVEHAQRELALIGEDPELTANLIGVIEKFTEFGHSGGSAAIAVHHLERLLRQEPLSPLTSHPDEWIDRTEMTGRPLWQNARDSRAFSEDGGRTWWLIDGQGNRIQEQTPQPE